MLVDQNKSDLFESEARENIKQMVSDYFKQYKEPLIDKPFRPGDRIPYAGRIYTPNG